MSNEKINSVTKSSHRQLPSQVYDNARIKIIFNGDFLKQEKITYNHGPTVNIYTVYRLSPVVISTISCTLENCLFGAVELTKHDDIDKYNYSGYGIGFDSNEYFSHPSVGFGKNVITFGADMSSSVHANNKTRNILVLGKNFIQGTGNKTIYAEQMYSTNFTVANKKFCLSLHYNGDDSYLLVNGKEIIKNLKQTILKFCHIHNSIKCSIKCKFFRMCFSEQSRVQNKITNN